jgi:glycosyltransferase involved in cell wall biosynthesis
MGKELKMKLSIVVPFIGEYMQSLFTIQSVAQDLIGRVDFEIIAVNNYCEQARKQSYVSATKAMEKMFSSFRDKGKVTIEDMFEIHKSVYPTYEDRSGGAIKACEKLNDWLKYIEYNEKLSHWQAKRIGVENSTGDILMFVDAHCVPSRDSIFGMFNLYQNYMDEGSMHLPLTYKILESRRLIYKLKIENDFFYSYSFTGLENDKDIFEVPCMSTCGMMVSRSIYNSIGGWPKGLGIYGGGENFFNYTLAVCDLKKYIYPFGTLFHQGEKRDYHYIFDDMLKNRMISHYLFGGEDLLDKLCMVLKGRMDIINKLKYEVLQSHKDHRELIKQKQKITIEDWRERWI